MEQHKNGCVRIPTALSVDQSEYILGQYPVPEDTHLGPDDLPYLVMVLSNVGALWRDIHIFLGITRSRDEIGAIFPRNPLRCLTIVLNCWLNRQYDRSRDPGKPSWRKVVKFVASEIGGKNAAHAEYIAKNYKDLCTLKLHIKGYAAAANAPSTSIVTNEEDERQRLLAYIMDQLKTVAAHWFDIGVLLGVRVGRLEELRPQADDANTCSQCLQNVVEEFLTNVPSEVRTWKVLVNAVEHKAGGGNPLLAEDFLEHINSKGVVGGTPSSTLTSPPPPSRSDQQQNESHPPSQHNGSSLQEYKLKLDPSNIVQISDVLRKCGFPPSSWDSLAPRLCKNMDAYQKIDTRAIRTSQSDDELCLQETIRQWLQKDGNATWEQLAQEVGAISGCGEVTKDKILKMARSEQ